MESLNKLFDIFSRERRRYAIYVLEAAKEPLEVDELAERIQQMEEADENQSSDEVGDIKISLTHGHLPKAAEAKYIEYDQEDGEVRITGEPTEFQIILSVSEAIEHPDASDAFSPDMTLDELVTKIRASWEASD